MFGRSDKEKYNAYLQWFAENVKDQSNWDWMRADKDCANYMYKDQTPLPYGFGEALFMMGDPKQMAKAIEKYQKRTKAKIEDSYKYVGGNKENGLINPEYVKNNEARIAANKELAKSYGATPTDQQMKEVIEKHSPENYGDLGKTTQAQPQSFLDKVASMLGLSTDEVKSKLEGERKGLDERYKV